MILITLYSKICDIFQQLFFNCRVSNHGDFLSRYSCENSIFIQLCNVVSVSVGLYYVAVRTIVLSRHESNLARPVIIHDIIHSLMCMLSTLHCGFLGSCRMETAPTSIEVLLRPTRISQTSHLIYVVPTTRHAARCPSVYGTWQSQGVTHPIMNRARRCLTSVIKPTLMRQRRIPYISLVRHSQKYGSFS